MSLYKKKPYQTDFPSDFDKSVTTIITRIEDNSRVIGIMFFRHNFPQICTVPLIVSQTLSSKLPSLTSLFQTAIKEITDEINKINPMVDRMMEDDSVEGVIMTNKEGVPILTNTNLVAATNYGIGMRNLGQMAQISAQEIDPFDEVLILRIITKKIEVMVAPRQEFAIVVMQHARTNKKNAKLMEDKMNANNK
ncbi:dynein light chain roadblock-type 2 like protein [Danaus plexippus plexippus]|uniref:Dynein light chain roadblock-type 2 like protein n=1 Tax=Danaus plexippus plexippus TaxID=278856 RepID=A0A212FKB3_DANPL|nr:dynein light chain roadblock-type 2 like protein [Danaus plexippus plexippus]